MKLLFTERKRIQESELIRSKDNYSSISQILQFSLRFFPLLSLSICSHTYLYLYLSPSVYLYTLPFCSPLLLLSFFTFMAPFFPCISKIIFFSSFHPPLIPSFHHSILDSSFPSNHLLLTSTFLPSLSSSSLS